MSPSCQHKSFCIYNIFLCLTTLISYANVDGAVMPSYPYRPALTGAALDEAIAKTSEARTPLIEGLLYEHSVLLVSADGGTGKSTLVANVMAQTSLGLPVFQALHVPRPLLSYYIPFERGSEEIRERLKHIHQSIPFNSELIRIFDNPDFPSPNLYQPSDQDFLLASILKDCPDRAPDIIYYDPIYQAVAGGLCNEDRVSIFIRFNVRLMAKFRCATWLNHHTGKPQYTQDGQQVEKDDPYYGSSYLRNHCTGSYHIRRRSETDGDGTLWLRKKDNLDALVKKMTLTYQPETYTSYLKDFDSTLTVTDRLKVALRQFKASDQIFTFRQLQGCLQGVSTSYLRRLLETPPLCTFLTKVMATGKTTYYKVTGDI